MLNNQIVQIFVDTENPQDHKGNCFYDVDGETNKNKHFNFVVNRPNAQKSPKENLS